MYSLVIDSALFTAGFVASRLQPRIARAFVCFSVIFAMGIIVFLAMTGLMHDRLNFGEVHRWTAHGLTILNWILAFFSAGIVLGDRRPLGCVYRGLSLAAVAAASLGTLEASFTGYLYPHDDLLRYADTVSRFYVLHCGVVPVMLLGLHLC